MWQCQSFLYRANDQGWEERRRREYAKYLAEEKRCKRQGAQYTFPGSCGEQERAREWSDARPRVDGLPRASHIQGHLDAWLRAADSGFRFWVRFWVGLQD